MEDALKIFVQISRRGGLSDEEIRQNLLKQGWKLSEITAALGAPMPAPQPQAQTTLVSPAQPQTIAAQTTPVQVPVQPAPIATMPFYKKKSFYWVITCALLVAALAYGFSILAENNFYGWTFLGKETPETPEPPVTETTSDWETYSNQQFGFDFKYPNDWEINREEIKPPLLSASFVFPNPELVVELSQASSSQKILIVVHPQWMHPPYYAATTFSLDISPSGMVSIASTTEFVSDDPGIPKSENYHLALAKELSIIFSFDEGREDEARDLLKEIIETLTLKYEIASTTQATSTSTTTQTQTSTSSNSSN